MTRIFDLALFTCFVACLCCAFYLGNREGEIHGYTEGQLSIYKQVMGGAVYNLASLPVKETRR